MNLNNDLIFIKMWEGVVFRQIPLSYFLKTDKTEQEWSDRCSLCVLET